MSSVIQVEGVWKRYGLPLPRWLAGNRLPWALQELTFQVQAGETLGVIGRNGAGKSTALKLLAGVSPPTRGRLKVEGRTFPMIELNAGIHQELTGRENVRLLGAVMGLPRQQINQRMEEIEAFCGLGAWFDRPVRMYSSGMLSRLGFSVGAHVDADVLLMDEVLAVGDINFHNLCLRHLEEVRAGGRSILFVSHNMQRIRRMCDRVLVLEQGRVLFQGHPEEGIGVYEEVLRQARQGGQGQDHAVLEGMGIALEEVRWLEQSEPIPSIPPGGEASLFFRLRLDEPLEQVTLNVAIEDMEAVSVVWSTLTLPRLAAGSHGFRLVWRGLRLRAGDYGVRIGVVTGVLGQKVLRRNPALRLHMEGDPQALGVWAPEGEFVPVSDGQEHGSGQELQRLLD